MEPRGSMWHSQGLSNNPYSEPVSPGNYDKNQTAVVLGNYGKNQVAAV